MGTKILGLLAAGLLAGPIVSQAFVLGPTVPGKWGAPALGTGATITYSYMPTGSSCGVEFAGCSIAALSAFMPAGFETHVQAAFAAWSAVADVTFVPVADDGAAFNAPTTSGDIRLGGHVFDGPVGTYGHGYFPPANGLSAASDIHLDTAELWKFGFGGPGYDITQVLMQQIGFALGLAQSNVPNSLMNPFYTEAFFGPQADDIAGMRALYGAPRIANVPEPGTLALLGLGLAGLGLSRRRKA